LDLIGGTVTVLAFQTNYRSEEKQRRVSTYFSEDLQIDFERRKVLAQGRRVRLTPKEFELLHYLVTDEGKPLEYQWLLREIWGPDCDGEIQYLRVFINQLRRKIEPDPPNPKYIHTDSCFGYRFDPAISSVT
jgi:two-component system KDP operon response regulator KdpE